MLEHIPHWLGALFHDLRAGHDQLVIVRQDLLSQGAAINLSSPAFAHGARLPERFTADGQGVSPPLVWGPLPPHTASLALLVEDPDAPSLHPLVHALVWNLPADAHALSEGAIDKDHADVGLNSFFAQGWLPPDPPPGHGSHDYVFQLFALSEAIDLPSGAGRSDLTEAMCGRVLGAGMLVGTYSREEPASPVVDPVLSPQSG